MHQTHTRYASTIKQGPTHSFENLFNLIEGVFTPGQRHLLVDWPGSFLHVVPQGGQSPYEAFKSRCEELTDGIPGDDGVDPIVVVDEVAEAFLVEAVVNSILSVLCFSADQSRKAKWLDNNYTIVMAVEQAMAEGELTAAAYQDLLAQAEYQFEDVTPSVVRSGGLYRRFCESVVANLLPPVA